MASSQVECLDDENVNCKLTESFPQFVYSEGQRSALEALLAHGPEAFTRCLEREGLRPFLSASEVRRLQETAERFRHASDPSSDGEAGAPSDEQLSSSTYWPRRSDTMTPFLTLGWPEFGLWKGITRASVYTHPPLQNAPTIKEVVRRLIQNAKQVIAVVMDQFTDVDIFLDLVDVSRLRKIPVYILLDQRNVPQFQAMSRATSTNLWLMEYMRVRVLVGCSFCSRDGLSVLGSVKERFLLVDGESVVTGTYSFTWSDARLDRNLVTLMTGQVVDSFDQEFRTLYASSRPLPADQPLPALPNGLCPAPPRLDVAATPPSTAHRIAARLAVKLEGEGEWEHPGIGGGPVEARWGLGKPKLVQTAAGNSLALSDILRNMRRSKAAASGAPKASKSLWDLSAISQLSGRSFGNTSTLDLLELGEDAKTRLLKTQTTPAAALMKHRLVQKEADPLPAPRDARKFYPTRPSPAMLFPQTLSRLAPPPASGKPTQV